MQLRNFYPADMNCNNLCSAKQMVPALERWDHLHQKTQTPQNSFLKTGPRLLSFKPPEDALSHTHLPDKLWTLPVLSRCKRRRNCISVDRVRYFTVLPHASFWHCPLSFLPLSSILWIQQNTAQHCGFFLCVQASHPLLPHVPLGHHHWIITTQKCLDYDFNFQVETTFAESFFF